MGTTITVSTSPILTPSARWQSLLNVRNLPPMTDLRGRIDLGPDRPNANNAKRWRYRMSLQDDFRVGFQFLILLIILTINGSCYCRWVHQPDSELRGG